MALKLMDVEIEVQRFQGQPCCPGSQQGSGRAVPPHMMQVSCSVIFLPSDPLIPISVRGSRCKEAWTSGRTSGMGGRSVNWSLGSRIPARGFLLYTVLIGASAFIHMTLTYKWRCLLGFLRSTWLSGAYTFLFLLFGLISGSAGC